MVLAQIKFIHDNHKTIILVGIVIGFLYPFFSQFEIPIINEAKYVLMFALAVAGVLFWEIYGQPSSKSARNLPTEMSQFNSPRPNIPQTQPQIPQVQFPQPRKRYPSSHPQPPIQPQKSSAADIDKLNEDMKQLSTLQDQYSEGKIPLDEITPEMETKKPTLPKKPNLLDVVRGKQKLPKNLIPPNDKKIKKKSEKNSFHKFNV